MGEKQSKPKPSPCGTPAKYQWHRKRGESCEICKAAYAAYYRTRYKRKTPIQRGPTKAQSNVDLVRAEKLRRKACMDCGLVINERTIVCIDFDHRDPNEKMFTISYSMRHVHPTDLIAEMAKCDAVCRNCHALRTHDQKHHLFRRVIVSAPTLFDCDGLHG